MTMNTLLEEAQQHLKCDYGFTKEMELLQSYLQRAGADAPTILQWVYAMSDVYVATRVFAGLELAKTHYTDVWQLAAQLVVSADPDDRDTGMEVLVQLDRTRAYPLVKHLLNDKYLYIQFEAVEVLKEIYPTEVRATLQKLLFHDEERVRQEAQQHLEQMDNCSGDGLM